ncbi:hypothetical protein V6N13_017935 [Hibiscus sabdariffa]
MKLTIKNEIWRLLGVAEFSFLKTQERTEGKRIREAFGHQKDDSRTKAWEAPDVPESQEISLMNPFITLPTQMHHQLGNTRKPWNCRAHSSPTPKTHPWLNQALQRNPVLDKNSMCSQLVVNLCTFLDDRVLPEEKME